MHKFRYTPILLFLLIAAMSIPHNAYCQQNKMYGNEWINYDNSYVRIGIEREGVQRISLSSLPSGFPKDDPSKFQIWHRGKEVAILSANSTEILFYGLPNDGAGDSLVYRPSSARLNPHANLFSDLGYYFLTISSNARRAERVNINNQIGVEEKFHYQTDLVKYTNQFAGTTFNESLSLNNSFYDSGDSWTGPTIAGPSAVYPPNIVTTELIKSIQLKNWVDQPAVRPEVELLINGLQEGQHNIHLSVGKSVDADNLRKVSEMPFVGWGGIKSRFSLNSDDISPTGASSIKLKSITTSNRDWFGLTYLKVTYPQLLDMKDSDIANFFFPPSNNAVSSLKIANVPLSATLYDVSDPDSPKILTGKQEGNLLSVSIARNTGRSLKLMIVSESSVLNVASKDINQANFLPVHSAPLVTNLSTTISPSSYDFLIITTGRLKEGAVTYANYRSSVQGGSNKTLVVDIRDVYDQFNYGEPSPIAIRNFVSYMLKDGKREKHNLLLLGHSVSMPIRVVKEMPEEVPTFGDPGSDMLLVAGLQGESADVPAIPVGRINAFNNQEILNYLEKVKTFEAENDLSWQKNILHLNGGHSVAEINQLKGILADLSPVIESGIIGGKVKPFVKTSTTEVEKVDISTDVNSGVGMITYFGHGSQTITDLDMGYVSEASRGYQNKDKYPLMYFNGCGVGNIFTSRTTQMLSSNWLLTPGKGAIAIIANSYKSYVSSSASHLNKLYANLFNNETNRTIGQILLQTAKDVITLTPNSYELANVHQSNLMGDPSLRILNFERPDYLVKNDMSLFLRTKNTQTNLANSDSIFVGAIVYNGGKYNKTEKIDVQLDVIYKNGQKETRLVSANAISFSDTVSLLFPNKQSIHKVSVTLDPKNLISEKSKDNNYGELIVDWEVAKNEQHYPIGTIEDVIAPILDVRFNGREAANNQVYQNSPLINIELKDDRVLDVDMSLISVFIKKCSDDSCQFEEVLYEQGLLSIERLSNANLKVTYTPNLENGDYELRIMGKDNAGNSIVRQFVIKFKIDGLESNSIKLNVSPNPASDYIKFSVCLKDEESIQKLEYKIYDINGRLVVAEVKEKPLSSEIGWVWYPNVVTGLYIYQVEVLRKNQQQEVIRGKIIVNK